MVLDLGSAEVSGLQLLHVKNRLPPVFPCFRISKKLNYRRMLVLFPLVIEEMGHRWREGSDPFGLRERDVNCSNRYDFWPHVLEFEYQRMGDKTTK